MKIKFSKREDGEIVVAQVNDKEESQFSYIEMIKSLINTGKLDAPEIVGDFSEPEIASIKSMFGFINKEVDTFKNPQTSESV